MPRGEIVAPSGSGTRELGFPGKRTDKRRCVEIALKEFSDWGDSKIADVCGVSHPFVMKLRPQVVTVTTSTQTTRIGKDGKQYPAKRENRGWTAPEVAQ